MHFAYPTFESRASSLAVGKFRARASRNLGGRDEYSASFHVPRDEAGASDAFCPHRTSAIASPKLHPRDEYAIPFWYALNPSS